jgi:hypothetical protein
MLRVLVIGVHSRTEALAFALRHQLFPLLECPLGLRSLPWPTPVTGITLGLCHASRHTGAWHHSLRPVLA